MAKSFFGAVAVATCSALCSAGDVTSFTLSGGCDQLVNVKFNRVGYTLSGAPYYKVDDADIFMYWDADCAASTDGQPRWIIDDSQPNLEAPFDLDQDGSCSYLARIDARDSSQPPSQGAWTMDCAGDTREKYLTLDTGSTTTTRTSTTTAVGTTTRTWGKTEYHLQGACTEKNFLNDLTFEYEGQTRDGRSYFKARSFDAFIYYDSDCDGLDGPVASSRWIIDDARPHTGLEEDLDADRQCEYHARVASTSFDLPLSSTWKMYCGANGWVERQLSFRVVSATSTTTTSKGKAISSAMSSKPVLTALSFVIAGALQFLF